MKEGMLHREREKSMRRVLRNRLKEGIEVSQCVVRRGWHEQVFR